VLLLTGLHTADWFVVDESDNDDVVLIKEEIEVDSDDVIFLSEDKPPASSTHESQGTRDTQG